jgi:hypothetical protein
MDGLVPMPGASDGATATWNPAYPYQPPSYPPPPATGAPYPPHGLPSPFPSCDPSLMHQLHGLMPYLPLLQVMTPHSMTPQATMPSTVPTLVCDSSTYDYSSLTHRLQSFPSISQMPPTQPEDMDVDQPAPYVYYAPPSLLSLIGNQSQK